ncbi:MULTISPECIES: lecithin retinol acyltransferase family protein [Pseudanabaena]|uniref:Lecithin retinol acyltransferase family protein n=1 Tax=Pseudanabaena catenata USMAC16 TaxID=1855837 RepID=A0A9X4RIG3_9CYAN|nr:lecithin retinol acyltransferase family protein [Pseudanabaena catenata]MDG3495132.1 lecithin retinol acyltransferase family protein [Pseudanabaena catenata USMAC16]
MIHYFGNEVRKDSLKKFAHGDINRISVKSYYQCSDVDKVRARAKRKLGERKYKLLTCNCEHFATWCKTGKWKSNQIEQLHKSTFIYVGHHSYKAIRKVSKETTKATSSIRKVFKRLRLI